MPCVFADPVHAGGGCIFADPTETIPAVPFDPTTAGSGGYTLPGEDQAALYERLHADDERVLMAVIKTFLEMRKNG